MSGTGSGLESGFVDGLLLMPPRTDAAWFMIVSNPNPKPNPNPNPNPDPNPSPSPSPNPHPNPSPNQALAAKELEHAQEEERTKALGPLLTRLVFGSVSRSLFKRDRLTYAVHLVHLLHPHLFGEHEWEVLSGTLLVDGGAAG